MKKFKLSAMLILMSALAFSACGGGGSDDSDDPNYTIEIRPAKGTLYLNCEYVFYASKENNSKHLDNIIWEVDDTSAAKINADGRLTPLKAGKFKVTGTTVEGEVGMAECTVSSVSVREVFESSSGSISSYLGDDTDVIIPASINGVGIIKIDEKAFYFLTGLKSVEISSGVTSIEEDAFSYCNSLVSINIPLSVTSIGYSAFNYCSSLESIDIPSGVLSIGHFAFQGCSSLEIINIPSGVTSILDNVFEKCSSLKSIEIPTGVTSIGNYAFTDCSNLDTLRVNAVEPPDVAPYVFKGCSKLTKIEVPSASVSNYKSASGWKDFDDMIVGF